MGKISLAGLLVISLVVTLVCVSVVDAAPWGFFQQEPPKTKEQQAEQQFREGVAKVQKFADQVKSDWDSSETGQAVNSYFSNAWKAAEEAKKKYEKGNAKQAKAYHPW